MVGYSAQDLMGRSLIDFAYREDLKLLNDAGIAQLSGEATTCEMRLIRSDGKVAYIQVSGTPRWHQGKVIGSFIVITNLTDHYTAELEEKVYERTVTLAKTNEILLTEIIKRKRAEEMLNMSLEQKEIILREIHRKVKNNLELISSLLYLQSKSAIEKRPSEIIMDCQNRVRSMAIIHDKLSNSRDLTKINLEEYVKSLVDSLYKMYNVNRDRIDLNLDVEEYQLE